MLEIIQGKKGEQVKLPTIPVPRILIGFQGAGHVNDLRVK